MGVAGQATVAAGRTSGGAGRGDERQAGDWDERQAERDERPNGGRDKQ